MKNYNIIGTNSSGNAIIYFDEVLVDVGLSYTKLKDYLKPIKIVLLTHQHGDHFQLATINKIAIERPDIVWIVPKYLIEEIKQIKLRNVFEIHHGIKYKIGEYRIEAFDLYHDIANVGYKIIKNDYKIVHATDTGKIDHIEAKDFDLYAIEYNYDEIEIHKRIKEKKEQGLFSYEIRALDSHLSFQKADSWINSQKKESSEIIKLHTSSYYDQKEN